MQRTLKRNFSFGKSRKTFKKHTSIRKPVFGRIFADWCGHCESMKPAWKKLKKYMKNKWIAVSIEDKQQERRVPNINRLLSPVPALELASGFPYIFKIVNHKLETYDGSRDFESMKNWLNSPI